jgi:hypothetical protein
MDVHLPHFELNCPHPSTVRHGDEQKALHFSISTSDPLVLVVRVLAAPNDEEEVRKTVGGFSQSRNNHDMEAFGNLFATDAVHNTEINRTVK